MTVSKIMDTNFLNNCKSVVSGTKTTETEKIHSQTVTWDLTPGYVDYNFKPDVSGNYGSYYRKGRYQADGIYHYSTSTKKYTRMSYRHYLFEGIKLTKIGYRINNGAWKYITNSKGLSGKDLTFSYTSKANKDVVELKATYEIWTQGYPFRNVPFMRMSTQLTSLYYGNNVKFTDAKPNNPGRNYSGILNMSNGKDLNSQWVCKEVSWYQPESNDSKTTNWAYLDANGSEEHKDMSCHKGTWYKACCQHFDPKVFAWRDPDLGWTLYNGLQPTSNRRSMWWRYTRVYSSTQTLTYSKETIEKEKPKDPVYPKVNIKVIDNLTNEDEKGRLNGIHGDITVEYYHEQGSNGIYNLTAYQYVNNKIITTHPIVDEEFEPNTLNTIHIDFTKQEGKFIRGNPIYYNFTVKAKDTNYNIDRSWTTGSTPKKLEDLQKLANIGKHYYNEEPKAPNITAKYNYGKYTLNLTWDSVNDPDGDEVFYTLYILRKDKENTVEVDNESKILFNDKSHAFDKYYSKIDMDKNTSYNISTKEYDKFENLKFFIVAYDKYYNNYYYTTYTTVQVNTEDSMKVQVLDNLTNPINGKIYRDRGHVILTNSEDNNYKVSLYSSGSLSDEISRDWNTAIYTSDSFGKGSKTYTSLFDNIQWKNISKDTVYGITYKMSHNITIDGKTQVFEDIVPTEKHHYIHYPEPTNICLAEDCSTAFDDGEISIYWSAPTCKQEVAYDLYIGSDLHQSHSVTAYTKEGRETRKYDTKIELGYLIPTYANAYKVNIGKYGIDESVYMWLVTKDEYYPDNFYSGNILHVKNPYLYPYQPTVSIYNLNKKCIYDNTTKIDAEHGGMDVSYNQAQGKDGEIHICGLINNTKYNDIVNKTMKNASTDKYILEYVNIFGESKRNSIISYYTYAKCSGQTTYKENWNVSDCISYHKFGSVPKAPTISIDETKCDKYKRLTFTWNKIEDAHGYFLFINIDKTSQQSNVFYFGDNHTSKILNYTEMYKLTETEFTMDISKYNEETNFQAWIVPYNDYANSYYYTSNILSFDKPVYPSPKFTASISQDHSEFGYLDIKNLNTDHAVKIDIYAYIDGKYTSRFRYSKLYEPEESKTITVNFSDINYKRSVTINYFIIATDTYTGKASSSLKANQATTKDFIEGFHYYNDEPYNTVIKRKISTPYDRQHNYPNEYVNITWDEPKEPDKDEIEYYIYYLDPTMDDECNKTTTITDRFTTTHEVTYNTQYKIIKIDKGIVEKNDDEDYVLSPFEVDKEKTYYDVYKMINEEYVLQYSYNWLGFTIDYNIGEENEYSFDDTFKISILMRDNRGWDNSYYGFAEYVSARKQNDPPQDVELTVTPNLEMTGDGEHGEMIALYNYSSNDDISAIVRIYAYQYETFIEKTEDDEEAESVEITYKCKVFEELFESGTYKSIEIDFTEFNLDRSKYIYYYATAEEIATGASTMDEKDFTIFNVPFEKLSGAHYYNEEPPCTEVNLYNEDYMPTDSVQIKWDMVEDPDEHNVNYAIYMASSNEDLNGRDVELKGNVGGENLINNKIIPTGYFTFLKKIDLAYRGSKDNPILFPGDRLTLDLKDFDDNDYIKIVVVTHDDYINSYYRNSNMLEFVRGHKSPEPSNIYPKNNSTVYSLKPRILIELKENEQYPQTIHVLWNGIDYDNSNEEHTQYFSSAPGYKNYIVFKPPEDAKINSGNKVEYYVYTTNTSDTPSDKVYSTYIYKDFFRDYTSKKFLPLKAEHSNGLRRAINDTRNAYGLSSIEFTHEIKRSVILEEYDFNEIKNGIMEVNDLINQADLSEETDYLNPLIVDVLDHQLIEYSGSIEANTYTEFLEWSRIIYVLQNI